jgi:superfamily II DNA or RNA helicase
MCQRRFGWIPKKCITYYLKKGLDDAIVVEPTIEDIKEVDRRINEVREKMMTLKEFPKCCEDGESCGMFCPYGPQCFGTKEQFVLTLENAQITITKGLTPLLEKGIKKAFSFEDQNAHFIRKNSRWDGVHRLYNERHKCLGIGFLPRLTALIKEYCEYKKIEADIVINDGRELATNTHEDMPDKFMDGTELRDYQLEAVDAAIEKKVGILGLSVSAGKTTIAAEIIRRLNLPTLFIVDRKELLTQAKERFEKHLKIKIGIIGDSEEDWQQITVATIQTLEKRINNYRTLLADVGLLILDECHIGAAETIRKVSRQCLNASYRIGMSGSPKRTDGKTMMIEENYGEVIYEMKLAELIERGYATKPVVEFHTVHTTPFNTYSYNEDYQYNVALNVDREKLVLEQVVRFKDKKILILVKLVNHGMRLHEKIPGSIHIHGSVESKKRTREWEEFVKSEKGCCVATLSIAAKGLDVVNLSTLINASGHKNETSSLQTIGRIVRKLEGKTAHYIDFRDCGKFTHLHSRLRQKTFEDEGHEVKVLP